MGGKKPTAPAPAEPIKPPTPAPDANAAADTSQAGSAESFAAANEQANEDKKAQQAQGRTGIGDAPNPQARTRRDVGSIVNTSAAGGNIASSAVITG